VSYNLHETNLRRIFVMKLWIAAFVFAGSAAVSHADTMKSDTIG
jgi:hypothetical protein